LLLADQGGWKQQLGCVSERRRVQEGPNFRINALLLLFADYASPAQAVGFYRHQSRRGCVFDWKDNIVKLLAGAVDYDKAPF
jgi:hypothetical protein